MCVVTFDQVDLPIAFPLLDLTLASPRRFGGLVKLEPNEPVDLISRRKSGHDLLFMLPHTTNEIGGHPDV